MKKTTVFSLMLLIVVTMLSSCATIISGSRQTVIFNSEPSEATVYTSSNKKCFDFNKGDAIAIGKTPLTVDIKRNTPLIFIQKDGYKDSLVYCYKKSYRKSFIAPSTGVKYSVKVKLGKYNPSVNGWYLGNLLYGGVYGMLIDLATGSYLKLPNAMAVSLVKK